MPPPTNTLSPVFRRPLAPGPPETAGHVQGLSPHHALGSRLLGQAGDRLHHPLRRELGPGQGLEGGGEQSIPRQDGGGLSVNFMVGGPPPAQVVVVHAGQIVVDQGVAVQHLDGSRKGFGCGGIAPQHVAYAEHQNRPHPFAAAHQAVAGRLTDL